MFDLMTTLTLDSSILKLGNLTLTLGHLLLGLAIGLLILMFAMFRARTRRREELEAGVERAQELEVRLAELAGSLQGFAVQTSNQQANMHRLLDERLDMVGQRVGHGLSEQSERTTEQLTQLHERLAVIDAAQANITSLSGEMVTLRDILSNKQTRGAFGQGRMEAIIRDGLHQKAFEFQATLSNGTRPDCLVTLPESRLKLVIDAKFPLEAYNAMRSAPDELSLKAAEAQLRVDVTRHVKDISEKYLISGETNDTAIMFIPSESIYSELHERFEDVVQKAHRARVIFASPNVLMLLVQTLQSMVKDASMREQAHLIKGEVTKMLDDVGRLNDRVGDLRKHFEQASGDIDKITISTKNIGRRGERIESLDLGEELPAVEAPRPKLIATG
jgi:DNA recombination protein RmuC